MKQKPESYRIIPGFNSVRFMRQQRDKISKDIQEMDFHSVKKYFATTDKKSNDENKPTK
jgi:hypothetical protein